MRISVSSAFPRGPQHERMNVVTLGGVNIWAVNGVPVAMSDGTEKLFIDIDSIDGYFPHEKTHPRLPIKEMRIRMAAAIAQEAQKYVLENVDAALYQEDK